MSDIAVWDRQRIVDLLIEAGRIALGHRGALRRELKPDSSIVTQADRDVEAMLAAALERPSEGVYVIGEETIEQKGEDFIRDALRSVAYVIDPVDGTAPYAHGLPWWGVSIGRLEAGRLTDGAVILPEIREGEIVVSDGDRVVEGVRRDGVWSWRTLEPVADGDRGSLISISQDMARFGTLRCSNGVQALGTAVVPLVGLLQGRFLAYVGHLKLWDVAGCLPLLARHGFALSHLAVAESHGDETTADRMDLRVLPEHYEMSPSHPERWRVKGGLLVCRPEHEAWLRELLVE